MNPTQCLGWRASFALSSVGVAYLLVVAFGILEAGFDRPIVDPTLALMEALTLLSAPLVVAVMAAIHAVASAERKVFGVLALVFASLMAGLTSAVHFVTLTAGRQTDFVALEWPSALYAVELLAWDGFLGLALLSAACVFVGSGRRATVRRCLVVTGALALLGTVGPILGDMGLQRIGILGYGAGLPITSFVLARFFRTNESLRSS